MSVPQIKPFNGAHSSPFPAQYIDGRSALDLTPLHVAISHGHQAAAAALIKWGAALTSRCNLFLSEGQVSCYSSMQLVALCCHDVCLDWLSSQHQLALCHCLAQGGCIPHSTPAHLAAAKGDSATTLLLLREWVARVQRHGVGAGPDPRTLLDYLSKCACQSVGVSSCSHLALGCASRRHGCIM